jgi:hypothetical protein
LHCIKETYVNRPINIGFAAAIAFWCLSVAGVRAQSTLAVNGQTSIVSAIGSSVEFAVTGQSGLLTALLIDRNAGPTNLFGLTIPLGLTPALVVEVVGVIPQSGTLNQQLQLPYVEALHAERFYFAAVSLDALAPSGLVVSNGVDLTVVARPELAGNALTTFPFFEHVASFNRLAPVSLAIDPRYSYVAGRTADIYVVPSQTATQWNTNTALVDARGAPQTVTFPVGATTIQQNTFVIDTGLLPGPDETAGAGDIRTAVGYDIVIDFGQDGVFDDGVDLIDGYDEDEAGFYVVRDLARGGLATNPSLGPYAVSVATYTGGSFLGQRTYYPSNIAMLGLLPLVVVSHGNGHDYTWYNHIGYHLASHGYVVMSHQNNTMPGSHTAADTTLSNTDYFLGNLTLINGGVFDGHIDVHNLVWLGHSRGADGVARAYDKLFRGVVTPANYVIGDIKLVSSMAPVDFGGWAGGSPILGGAGNGSHPHDANFHLWVAQADDDVNGCASSPEIYWYTLHERATRKRQSISLYGVGHGDLHDGGGSSVASGPALIGRPTTHQIMRGYLLALVNYHIRGDLAGRDYLWRQYESFRPVGAPTSAGVSVNLMFQDDAESGKYIIDDFQNQSFVSPNLATSGASVTIGVPSFVEGRCDDANNDFSDSINDPFNGFTFDNFDGIGNGRSDSFACVLSFDGGGDYDLTYDLSNANNRPNFSKFRYLSFRAAQGSRHPLTAAVLDDLTFSVALEDAAGNRSWINLGAYGGGIEEPYQRNTGFTSCGIGTGWNSEFETIRIRLTDFLNNGSGVNLAAIRKVVFGFGPSYGSTLGRIGLDEIELTTK